MTRPIYRDDDEAVAERVARLRRDIAEQGAMVSGLRDGVLSPQLARELARHRAAVSDELSPREALPLLDAHARFLTELCGALPELERAFGQRDDRRLNMRDLDEVTDGFVELSETLHEDEFYCENYKKVETALSRITDKVRVRTLVEETDKRRREIIWATFIVEGEQYYLTHGDETYTKEISYEHDYLGSTVQCPVPRNMAPLVVEPFSLISRIIWRFKGMRLQPGAGHDAFDGRFMVLSDRPVQRYITRDLVRGLLAVADRDPPTLTVRDGMAKVRWFEAPDELSVRGAVKVLRSLIHSEVPIFRDGQK